MSTVLAFFVYGQVLGAALGVAAAIWGEIAYLRMMRDGKIDEAERAHLTFIARGLRYGMTIILFSSLGIVVEEYLQRAALQPALSAGYWALMMLAILVTIITWALSRKLVSFSFGSVLVFSGWWFLSFHSLGLMSQYSFGSAVALFVVATAVFYAVLQYIRFLSLPRSL